MSTYPTLWKKELSGRDLYYRLASMPIAIAPLRERVEDIPYTVNSLLPVINRRLSGNVRSISGGALHAAMCSYRWPGNVRELINAVEQSIFNAYPGTEIDRTDLPAFLKSVSHNEISCEKEMRKARTNAVAKSYKSSVEDNKRKQEKSSTTAGNFQNMVVSKASLSMTLAIPFVWTKRWYMLPRK